ncbi:oligosaccharide flippase family protein [Brevundimonas sp. SL130]|uniref:oligosaccharide flippase family protein n=1 Tax=Brevundimonas sp. SL130 TaxID=2995143 RepID=UPI00226CEA53|nr:oligosaccharide flippase family protein [Brevundimonas sp. SL130]WAC59100.1 oligosaccharide flippase family protein [Brevundimonas sp. SL130]
MIDAGLVYGAHGLRFLAPLLLYPVLTRRFGVEGFGLYVAAVSLAAMTAVVVDYGASLSGPRDIAAARQAAGSIIGRMLALRAVLVLPAAILGLLLGWINPVLAGAWAVVGAGIALGVGQGASLVWVFQGLRDPAPAALAEVAGTLAAAVVVMLSPGLGAAGALAVQAAGLWLGVGLGAAMMLRRVQLKWPERGFVRRGLVEGGALFASRAAVVAYTGAGGFVVAALAGPAQAAIYAVADKVVAAASSLMRPLVGLVGPRIAGLLAEDAPTAFRTARWSLMVTPGLFLGVAAGLWLAAPLLVRMLVGEGFGDAAGVLRTLVFVLPLVAASQVLGLQLMTALRMDGRFALMVGLGCVATLAPAVALAPGGGALGMAGARLTGEAVVVLASLACLRPHWRFLFTRGRHVPAV